MEQILTHNQVVTEQQVESTIISDNNRFIEANTQQVSLPHLKHDCIIPVFAKDNESTIAHYEFIEVVRGVVKQLFPNNTVSMPNIRTSHIIKGRIPSAVGKSAQELKDHEKTIYYDRMAFMIEIPQVNVFVQGQRLNLTVGGVRSYSEQNLFSKKSLEKFKLFIGFKNMVCCNLCISTDGLKDDLKVGSTDELRSKARALFLRYDPKKHAEELNQLAHYTISQDQFAHLVGKMKLYPYLDKSFKKELFELTITDAQINNILKNYIDDFHFGADPQGYLDLWKLYNLFTESAKSNYIDNFLGRNTNAYNFMQHLSSCIKHKKPDYFLEIHDIR